MIANHPIYQSMNKLMHTFIHSSIHSLIHHRMFVCLFVTGPDGSFGFGSGSGLESRSMELYTEKSPSIHSMKGYILHLTLLLSRYCHNVQKATICSRLFIHSFIHPPTHQFDHFAGRYILYSFVVHQW